MPVNKSGPLTQDELQFIQDNYDKLNYKEIAKTLRRNTTTIKSKIADLKIGMRLIVEPEVIENNGISELESKPFWKQLQKAYTKEELILYKHNWASLVTQYKDDITHSEEMQIRKVIDLDILIFRNLAERNTVEEQIEALDDELTAELRGARDTQKIISLNQQITGLRASQSSRTKEYNDMVQRQQAMMRDLKSTRDQRLDRIENGKATFFGWMKLHTEETHRKKTSHEAELIRLAMNKEKEKLSQYHKYEDGEVDQPLLTPELIKEDNK